MRHVDVLIAGGGPAASAMALYTDERLSVLVVEKRRLLDDDHFCDNEKCCGGMLDDTAQKVLTGMNIALPEEVIASPQVFSVKAVDFMTGLERTYQRNYMNIHRVEFDRMMLRKAAQRPNVEVMEGTVCYDFMESVEGVAVCLRHEDGETEVVMARYLVGADGAQSLVKRELKKQTKKGPLREPKVYVSLQEWFDYDTDLPHYMAMFDRKVTDFYSWVIPKRGDRGPQVMVGTMMPQKKLKERGAQERFELLKEDLMNWGMDLSRSTKKLGAVVLRPHTFGSVWTGDSRVFLIGEAAGLISPSSAEGISFALRSGMKLGQSMHWAVTRDSVAKTKKQHEIHIRDKRIKNIVDRFNEKQKQRKAETARKEISHKELIRVAYLQRIMMMRVSISLKTLKSPLMYNIILRTLIFWTRLTSIRNVGTPDGGN